MSDLTARFAKIRSLIEENRKVFGTLVDEVDELQAQLLGSRGPGPTGDPRLLSVVPEDLEGLLRGLDAGKS